jgi:hypothetical protein
MSVPGRVVDGRIDLLRRSGFLDPGTGQILAHRFDQ